MTREAQEMLAAHSTRPILNKVTSLKNVNPANAPDAWEAQPCAPSRRGRTRRATLAAIGGQPYMRLLKPLAHREGMPGLSRLARLRVGDVRGALSIGVPMQSYFEHMAGERRAPLLSHLLIWVIGVCGIGALGVLVRRAEQDLRPRAARHRERGQASGPPPSTRSRTAS